MADEPEPAFDFHDWASKSGLNRKTTGAMVQEDMTNLLTLTAMSVADVGHLDITRGQHSLVRYAVAALGNTNFNETPTPSMADGCSTAGDTLRDGESTNNAEHQKAREEQQAILEAGAAFDKLWKRAEPTPATRTTTAAGYTVPAGNRVAKHGSGADPRHALTIRAKNTKALRIVDYLTRTVRERISKKRKEVLKIPDAPAGVIQLKTEDDNCATIYLSQGEWAAANMCLMAHLLQSGDLLREDVEYYMSYTANIHNYTAKFDWQSIIEFDTQYRETQAEHLFMWGVPATYLEIQLLVPRQRTPLPQKGKSTTAGAAYHGPFQGSQQAGQTTAAPKSTVICRLWANSGSCPYDPCKFDHPKRA